MIEISLNNIKKSYGSKMILNDISFEIKTNEKVALIGENGCGKTTLLNIISRLEKEDSGSVAIRKGSTIGYLPQQPELLHNEKTIKEILYESLNDILSIENRLKHYEKKMQEDPNNIDIINKYLKIQEEFMKSGGYEINTQIEKITHGLNIDKMLDKQFKELSGGEQKRVLLASLIVKKTNILLLDEPTNHLDVNTLEWLEIFLNKYNGTVIVISHDRYFLDKVATQILLLENNNIVTFYGNYSYYLKENEERIAKEFKDYKDQQKLITALKKKIKQLEEFGKLAYPGGEIFFRRAQNIKKRLDKIELKEKPTNQKEIPLELDIDKRSGKDALIITKYDLFINEELLIQNINLKIAYGDKVCILGENGCGKTTLVKHIIYNNEDKIKIGSNVKIGYIPQQIVFEEDINILKYARKYFIGEESHLRSALSKFYFYGDNVYQKISKLSGGEKVRLKLFELIHSKSNFIILDEPTNHIDIYTKETLETALNEFKGTVLFISHDRYFINKLANKIINISDKRTIEYIGNYDYFISHKSN